MREVGESGRGIESLKDKEYGSKVRVGKYRVIINLSFNPDIIIVRLIDLRGRIYKNL